MYGYSKDEEIRQIFPNRLFQHEIREAPTPVQPVQTIQPVQPVSHIQSQQYASHQTYWHY